jgi:hypothetical protein
MKHVDEGELLTHLDGQLDWERSERVERHLERCDACRAELGVLRGASDLFSAALAENDAPEPTVSETTIRALRARAGRSAPSGGGWRDLRRAAVLVLGFAAAASATIPGSPVNSWLRELTREQPSAPLAGGNVEAPAAVPEEIVLAPDVAETGVSVLPEAGTVRVVLRSVSAELRVKAVLVEGDRAGVYAAGAARDARFSTAPGRIEVAGAGAGELRIELPHSAHTASVEVNGRSYITRDGDQLRLTVPAEQRSGAEVNFRVLQ